MTLKVTHLRDASNCYIRKLSLSDRAVWGIPADKHFGVFCSSDGRLMAVGYNSGLAVIQHRRKYPNEAKPWRLS